MTAALGRPVVASVRASAPRLSAGAPGGAHPDRPTTPRGTFGPDPPGEGTEPGFDARFQALARRRCDEICTAILDRAAEGDRWAAELVLKYVIDPAVAALARADPPTELLHDIRDRLADRTG